MQRSRRPLLVVIVLALAALAAASPAGAGRPNRGVSAHPNPLVGLPWGRVLDPIIDPTHGDVVSAYFNTARGEERRILRTIVRTPRFYPFGSQRAAKVREVVRRWIGRTRRGNRRVLVQAQIFKMTPWEQRACLRPPSSGEQREYLSYVDGFARALGHARAAIVLQPDMPFVRCVPDRRLTTRMLSWAAWRLSRQPHTAVYLDAGASDWLRVGQAARLLRDVGIRHARGFALNVTHHVSTREEVRYGLRIAAVLRRMGLGRRHFVVSTSGNGRPFRFQQVSLAKWRAGAVCASRRQRRCIALGPPPTPDCSPWAPRRLRRQVARTCDGLMWIDQAWRNNTVRRPREEVVRLATSSPFFDVLARRR